MVRHKVPPGITGLAQMKGFRGETRALKDMQARVRYRPRVPAQLVAVARSQDSAVDSAEDFSERKSLLSTPPSAVGVPAIIDARIIHMRETPFIPRVQAALSKRIRIASKRIYQTARWRGVDRQRILFIVGCMRSGTTLMTRLFDADLNCRVFGEFSELSSADKDHGIRLNPLPEVAAIISRVRAPLVVAKPLVETQNVRTLLNYFAGSKALFMYRRYPEVALSDLAKFGPRNGVDNIRPIAEGQCRQLALGRREPRGARPRFNSFTQPQMHAHDAAALFWYARNQLFFDLELPGSPAVMLCQYEHLVQQPVEVMREIY